MTARRPRRPRTVPRGWIVVEWECFGDGPLLPVWGPPGTPPDPQRVALERRWAAMTPAERATESARMRAFQRGDPHGEATR